MTNYTAIKNIILISIIVKIIYFLTAFIAANFSEIDFWERGTYRSEEPIVNDLLKIFRRNDVGWYERIAIKGHEKITPIDLAPNNIKGWQQSYYAFFPLYPYCIRMLLSITGDFTTNNCVEVSFLFSIVISLSCFICFFFFAKDYFKDVKKAFEATLLLIIFPFHYYFSVFYTEALFLLLVLLCFISINNKQYLVLYLAACLLVLTKATGILISIPLALWFMEKKNWVLERKDFYKIGLLFSLMSLTMIFYCIYLKNMTGDYFAFSTAQKGWNRFFSNPILTLLKVKTGFDSILSIYTVLFIILSFITYKKLGLSFLFLVVISLLIPISFGSVISMPRFISVLFPFMLVLTNYITPLSIIKRSILYTLLFILHIITFFTWLDALEFSC